MRLKEILSERLDYSKEIGILRKIVISVFDNVNTEQDDPVAKATTFLYELQDKIDDQILSLILDKYPIILEDTEIKSLTVSFKPIAGPALRSPSVKQLAMNIRRGMNDKDLDVSDAELLTQYINGRVSFTKEAEFFVYTEAKSALIRVETFVNKLANFLFIVQDPQINRVALSVFTNDLIGQIFHEVKHHVQTNKIADKFGYDKQVNRFYTGNPKTMRKNQKYEKTKSGYWLNSNEMDAWSTNIAAEIHNIFGSDQQAAVQYMIAVGQNKPFRHKGVSVNTHLAHYRDEIFNPRYKMNTDRTVLWQKLLKDVYKNLQMFD
jgi:hypothetical protein